MSSEIVVAEKSLSIADLKSVAKELSLSTMIPLALRKKPEDILAITMVGQELGLLPMQAIRGIHIIEGKPSMSADLLAALVSRSPGCEHLYLKESTGKSATYVAKRRGTPGETVMSFTIEQAKAAGLLGKGNWQKYPDAMLRARAVAAICRAVFPDVCFGIYAEDELDTLERVPASAGSMQAHASTVAAELRAAVAVGPTEAEILEAEIVEPAEGSVFAKATSVAELNAIVKATPKDQQAALRPAYNARKAELTK